MNALGSLFGSAIVGFLARRLLVCVLIASGLIDIGLAWLALVLLASLPALLALAPLVAVAGVMWSVSAGTMLQQEAPQEFLGRVLGAYGALGSLSEQARPSCDSDKLESWEL